MRQLKISKQITNRDTLAFNKYLTEVSGIPMLTQEEELELAKRIKLGDQDAIDKLVRSNLRFVISVAKQYNNKGMTLPDMVQEGNAGLIKAAARFDETRGFKFISYAVWWVRQSIMQAISENSKQIRLPINKLAVLNKINKAKTELEQILERTPDSYEISEYLINLESSRLNGDQSKYTEDKITESLEQNQNIVSLDAPLTYDEDAGTMIDTIEDNNSVYDVKETLNNIDLQTELERVIKRFPYRERETLIMFYGLFGSEQKSLSEIGSEFELTRERVRQLRERAIKRLKFKFVKTKLKEYA